MSKLLGIYLGRILLAGAQASVSVSVFVSQLGERLLRGARGFAVYREFRSEQA